MSYIQCMNESCYMYEWVMSRAWMSYVHPKTLVEIPMVLSTNCGSFPSNSHVSATFSILLRFGEFWNPTNCEKFSADGSLMGRTNLDKSVWLEQRSELRPIAKWFFCSVQDRPMGGKGIFLACVVKVGKRWGPKTLWFFTLEKHATKSHLPKLISRAGRSDISGPERGPGHSTA